MPMFRRLIMIVLVVGLALPAVVLPAHPAKANATAIDTHHDMSHPAPGEHDQDSGKTYHTCIGCIAEYGPAPGLTPAPALHELVLAERTPKRLQAHRTRPDTPPPRG